MWQRQAYNGHKKFHVLKYQAVMLLNGIIGHLFGTWDGYNADSFLLRTSKLLETCAEHAVRDSTDENMPAEEWFLQLFGDPAYGVSNQIISPFSGHGERKKKLSDFGIGWSSNCFVFIGLLALCT